jgi:cyclin A
MCCVGRLTPVCLHASVNLMDRCLSRFATPRHRLQLLGVCCLMLESQRANGYAMTIHDVCYISDSQYNDFEVHNHHFYL